MIGYFCVFDLNQGNVGFVFTKGDLKEVSDVVAKYKVMKSINEYGFLLIPFHIQ